MNPDFLSPLPHLSLLQDDLLLFVFRATLILLVALAIARIAKNASGQVHHLLWSTTFAAPLLVLPLSELLPKWSLAIFPNEAGVVSASLAAARIEPDRLKTIPYPAPRGLSSARISPQASGAQLLPTADSNPYGSQIRLTLVIYSIGVFLTLASLMASWLASGALARRCKPVIDSNWLALSSEIRDQLGIRRQVALQMSREAISPMTGGWLHPEILLQDSARAWNSEKRRTVLQHELSTATVEPRRLMLRHRRNC